jgi:hypothetical protein
MESIVHANGDEEHFNDAQEVLNAEAHFFGGPTALQQSIIGSFHALTLLQHIHKHTLPPPFLFIYF